jgi:hypothetical protein
MSAWRPLARDLGGVGRARGRLIRGGQLPSARAVETFGWLVVSLLVATTDDQLATETTGSVSQPGAEQIWLEHGAILQMAMRGFKEHAQLGLGRSAAARAVVVKNRRCRGKSKNEKPETARQREDW